MMLPGHMEWIVIGIVAVLIFGHKLPGLARAMGQSIVEFRKGSREGASDPKEEPPKAPGAEPGDKVSTNV